MVSFRLAADLHPDDPDLSGDTHFDAHSHVFSRCKLGAKFLILLLALLLPAHCGARELCRDCHQPHYESRGACTLCHRGNPATTRKNLAHAGIIKGTYARFMTADSSALKGWNSKIAIYGCRRCHRLGGAGNPLAADLDLSARKKSPEELATAIMKPVKAMPDFSFTEATVTEAVTAILAASAGSRETQTATRQVVHFESSGSATEDIFTEKCGGCHRALTSRNGSLGRGDAAPNLSGLFSSYYPGSYAKGERWSKERVEKWLVNPRQVRQNANMQPVKLTTYEIKDLMKLLRID